VAVVASGVGSGDNGTNGGASNGEDTGWWQTQMQARALICVCMVCTIYCDDGMVWYGGCAETKLYD
jgi:hypothetical protein